MPRGSRILVVDDDPGVTDWLGEELAERGYRVHTEVDPRAALEQVRERAFDLVLSDVEMPGLRGVDLLREVHEARPDQLVVLITAFGSIELAMKCVRAGASDFLAKPFTIDALIHTVERTLEERRLRREIVRLRSSLDPTPTRGGLVAESHAMRRALELARRAARTTSTVLLTGESGVGKSAIAGLIHDESDRRDRELVQLNCAALPAGLVEAELFGVRKGAFTDAREDRPGLLARADEGTLFLDEIGDMALEVQPKLLLALESGRYRPVGGGDERRFDLRLVAATNQPPEEAVEQGRLRADLYHRLNVIRIEVPPLRDRIADIPPLVDRLLHRLGQRRGARTMGITEESLRWLCAQPWPGNVRELSNVLERAVMLSDHDVLVLDDFVRDEPGPDQDALRLSRAADQGLSLAEVQRRYIELVLDRCDGNKAQAARVLGIDRTTIWRKLSS